MTNHGDPLSQKSVQDATVMLSRRLPSGWRVGRRSLTLRGEFEMSPAEWRDRQANGWDGRFVV